MTEARCPECREWFAVEIVQEAPLGWWWRERTGGCPGCCELILCETECEFRETMEVNG